MQEIEVFWVAVLLLPERLQSLLISSVHVLAMKHQLGTVTNKRNPTG
jgi:hypothetical protein